MVAGSKSDLERFSLFVAEQLANGGALSPEQALDLWRIENPSPEEHSANVAAVRAAIADMEAGDTGRPHKEVLSEIREQLGFERK